MLGANNAMVMQYRFAAVEYVEPERASKAISIVMSGALAAALLGPEIAVRAADIVAGAHYAGSFLAASGLFVLAAILLGRTPMRHAPPAGLRGRRGRSPRSRRNRNSASRCLGRSCRTP